MQFQTTHRIGDNFLIVIFNNMNTLKTFARESFYRSFNFIGGHSMDSTNA